MREAKLIWKRMCDPRDMDVRISHDGQWPLGGPCTHCSSFVHIDRLYVFVCLCFAVGYVKAWQVRQPKVTGFDCLLIDEAQDLTPGECALVLQRALSLIPSLLVPGNEITLRYK